MRSSEMSLVDQQMQNFLQRRIIEPCTHVENEIISNIFTRPKKDGSIRIILNLKKFNEHVHTEHFKMESLQSAIKLITPNCFLASIDLQDAYFSVPIAKKCRIYLRFFWKGKLYQFCVLPNGLACAPQVFTKITKPLMAYLRNLGLQSCIYIDDSLLKGENYAECSYNVQKSVQLFQQCGFYINEGKSCLIPTQIIEFLGFILNSIEMTIKLTDRKIEKYTEKLKSLLYKSYVSIQELAELIGSLVSAFPGVQYGKLHYRNLEIQKSDALKKSFGNFSTKIRLSADSLQDIQWWLKKH